MRSVVHAFVAELHPRHATLQISLDQTIERDLGIDSLGRVELFGRIERAFDVNLPEHVFSSAETVRDLLHVIRRATRSARAVAHPRVTQESSFAQAAPVSAKTLVEAFQWHAQTHSERLHIRLYHDDDDGVPITYRALWQEAEAVAVGLQHFGIEPGDRVAIMLPTGREYFAIFAGILLAAAVPVPLYPPARRSQLHEHLQRQRAILDNCQPTLLVTVVEAKRLAQLLQAHVASLSRIVTIADLSSTNGIYDSPGARADDIAFLQYTSGSTGSPKGVVLTHENLLSNIRVDGEHIEARSSDVFVSWLPLYHDMGLIGAWLGSLYFAIPLVVMSPLAFLSRPQRWLWAIHRFRGTLSAAPNFAYELCLSRVTDTDLEGLDLSSWRIAFNGAEAVSPETISRFTERFERFGFDAQAMYPVYGLAECTVGLAFPPLGRVPIIDRIKREPFMRDGDAIPADIDEGNPLRFVACGQPLAQHEIRIVDDDDRELPDRRRGRLQFCGPSATSGYYRNTEATRALFHGTWLDSGDLAYTVDGDVYLAGRIKDVIIRAGRNIYPEELEEALGHLAGVRTGRVTAFASDDPSSKTERLIVVAETRVPGEAERQRIRDEIVATTVDLVGTPPDEVVLAPAGTILKTSSGKLRRADSRALFEQGRIDKPRKAVWWQLARLVAAGFVPRLRGYVRSMVATIYAAYCWSLFGVLGAIGWIGVVALPIAEWRWRLIRWGVQALARATMTPITLHGLEHLPRDRPCVLVANHASYLDGYVMAAVIPFAFSFVAKVELLEKPLVRWFLERIDTVFVERFDSKQAAADAHRIENIARSGRSLMFFPEGTFTRVPGLLPFHMGAFVVAATADLPVVPVVIRGTRFMLRSDSWFPRRGRVSVTVGEAVYPEGSRDDGAGQDNWSVALRLRTAARTMMLRYCGEPDLSDRISERP